MEHTIELLQFVLVYQLNEVLFLNQYNCQLLSIEFFIYKDRFK